MGQAPPPTRQGHGGIREHEYAPIQVKYYINSQLTRYHPQSDKMISGQKTSFDWSVKTARWLSTNGLKLFLQFWYSKTPVYALPTGWFPYYVEWILSFPRAPLGSVSIQVWSNVCATTIGVLAEILGAMIVQVVGEKQNAVPANGNGKKTQ